MRKIQQSLPKARRSELITAELEGELLVYDRSSDKAHCLNETAAFVWARCDGRTMSHLLQELLARPAELNPHIPPGFGQAIRDCRGSRAGPVRTKPLRLRPVSSFLFPTARRYSQRFGNLALSHFPHRADCGGGGYLRSLWCSLCNRRGLL
jgi:hypothetical protein